MLRRSSGDVQTARPGSNFIVSSPFLKMAVRLASLALIGWLALPAAGLIYAETAAFFDICRGGTPEELAEAVARGADVNAVDGHGRTPLVVTAGDSPSESAADKARLLAKAEVLLKAGADPDGTDEEGASALHFAAAGGDAALTRALLAAGADPNRKEHDGHAPIHYAVTGDDEILLKMLLEAGAEVNAENADGFTALMYVCLEDEEDRPEGWREARLRLLLDHGASVRPSGGREDESWPLVMACQSDAGPETVRLLLAAGAPVNQPDGYGFTPLIAAAIHSSRPEVIEILLNGGARAGFRSEKGFTALKSVSFNETPAAGRIKELLEAAVAAEKAADGD